MGERTELCRYLVQLQGGRCYYCDGKVTMSLRFPHSPARASLERLTPKSEGGDYTKENTVAACQGCNNCRPIVSAQEFKMIRRNMINRWRPCTLPSKEIRNLLKERYGYHTGPIELFDMEQLIVTVD